MSTIEPDMSFPDTDTEQAWLETTEIDLIRGRVPMVYVEAVPVRVDDRGEVVQIGLLLRSTPEGTIARAIVSGRVLYGETLRAALSRHLAKDLGPSARPLIPPQMTPFTVIEYFPDPSITGFTDTRQHAVALCYIVPISGECVPAQAFLDIAWLTPDEAISLAVRSEMSAGLDRLLRRALAHVGQLP
jgi:ADP-ribose pyrophosphatase YjhB (NUDIX family)